MLLTGMVCFYFHKSNMKFHPSTQFQHIKLLYLTRFDLDPLTTYRATLSHPLCCLFCFHSIMLGFLLLLFQFQVFFFQTFPLQEWEILIFWRVLYIWRVVSCKETTDSLHQGLLLCMCTSIINYIITHSLSKAVTLSKATIVDNSNNDMTIS